MIVTDRYMPRTTTKLPRQGKDRPSLHRALKPEDMDETNRTPCLKNTRRNVIDDVLKWIADDSKQGKEGFVGIRLGRDRKEYSVDHDRTNHAYAATAWALFSFSTVIYRKGTLKH
jgi:SNF2 family DNA or RNA helicase